MKKVALRKDFIREVIKSKNRFISILFIVAMGVAFFSGIRATEPDMRYSYDEYFDEHNLFDIRILGTYGITEDDVEFINNLEAVEKAEPGYYYDLFSVVDGATDIIRVEGIKDNFNTMKIEDGRAPETNKELVIDVDYAESFGYKIGDKIVFESSDADVEIEDIISEQEFEIVGFVSSPMYISFSRGSTNVGSGQLDAFAFIKSEVFAMEAYTNVDIALKNAKQMTAFTSEYDDYVEDIVGYIEDNVSDVRCQTRYDEIQEEANVKIDDAQKELDDAKKEANEKLDDAAQKLADAKEELEDGEKKLADAKEKIADAWDEIEENEKLLQEKTQELEDGEKALNEGVNQYVVGMEEYNNGKEQIDAAIAQLEEGKSKYEQGKEAYESGREQIAELYSALEEIQTAMAGYAMMGVEPPAELQAQLAQIQEGISKAESELASAETNLAVAEQQISSAEDEISKNQDKLDAANVQLGEAGEQLAEASNMLDEGKEKLEEGRKELEDAKKELAEYEQDILDAEQELADGQKEYDDAYAEYEEKKLEAETEIADAEQELADARADIADLELPKWYVNDRSVLNSYTECGDNADRIKAIGKVFPVLFFVVAALISLTTMTRMVEEQRTLIGTLKALGYSKISIAGKYIMYALLATVFGSVFGALIGEKIFPYIIIYAYQIMFLHIPNIVIPYDMYYMVLSTIVALVCVLGAAVLSCYKELRAQSAELMRPVPPKSGKRILLERIPILWKQMNFTWKATSRNLFRYKKRFFMTVFGIGGCMALMVVGFGLRDSIMDIAGIQYSELQLYQASVIIDSDAETKEKEILTEEIKNNEKIKSYTMVYADRADVETESGKKELAVVVPLNTDEFKEYVVFRDRVSHEGYELDDTGVMITEKIANANNYRPGDDITIVIDDNEYTFRIAQIVENYMYNYIYISPQIYKNVVGEEVEYNSIYYKTVAADVAMTRDIGEALLKNDVAISVSYLDSIEEQVNDMLASLDIVIIVLIVSAGMLAIVVLYNLNNININERRRELASIRVLGFYDGELAAYVYRENVILTLIGAFFGVFMGKILHRFLIETVEIESCMFSRNIYLMSYVYSIIFTILFAILVNFVMYFKLKKIDMVESLKSVE